VEARAKAFEYKAKIARGENPVGQRDAERAALRAGKTLSQLVDEYLNLHAKPSWCEDERMIRRYLPSSWSSRRLSAFSRQPAPLAMVAFLQNRVSPFTASAIL
jgi:hypothetical protein